MTEEWRGVAFKKGTRVLASASGKPYNSKYKAHKLFSDHFRLFYTRVFDDYDFDAVTESEYQELKKTVRRP